MKACFCCGEPATTAEHVPPKCLFPRPRPTDLITVPACRDCNSGSKLDDEYFRLLITSATSDSEPAAALLGDRILPKANTKPALINSHVRSMRSVAVYSTSGLFVKVRPAFQFNRSRMQRVINKIVRGLFYHETRRRLLPDTKIDEVLLNPPLSPVHSFLLCSLPLRDVGDGNVFSYRFASREETSEWSPWYLMFYNQVLCVTAIQRGSDENPAQHDGH